MPETVDRAVDRARVIAMLEQLGRSPSHERMQQVFAIRDIPMKRIGWIGFDMDYTLAIYRREELDRLVHGLALERLVTVHGYPAEILEIPLPSRFCDSRAVRRQDHRAPPEAERAPPDQEGLARAAAARTERD